MKFSSKEDVNIPVQDLFGMLSDFETFERAALRRGAKVKRVPSKDGGAAGTSWVVDAEIRGKQRVLKATLRRADPYEELIFEGQLGGVSAEFEITLLALAKGRTRLGMALDMRPNTLSARLMIQSAKFARNTLNRRYKARIAKFAKELERRYKGKAAV